MFECSFVCFAGFKPAYDGFNLTFVNGTHRSSLFKQKSEADRNLDPPRQTVKFSGYLAVRSTLLRALVRPPVSRDLYRAAAFACMHALLDRLINHRYRLGQYLRYFLLRTRVEHCRNFLIYVLTLVHDCD